MAEDCNGDFAFVKWFLDGRSKKYVEHNMVVKNYSNKTIIFKRIKGS